MNFETADKSAKRLGVTVRAIQKWAKEGKIPYSHKVGRDWMIPVDAVHPGKQSTGRKKHVSFAAFPLMRFYTGGKIIDYINRLENEDERAMARCEYFYFTAKLKECTIEAEPYMYSEEPSVRSSASLYCFFSNLARGYLNKSKYAHEIMKETLRGSLENSSDNYLSAVSVLASVCGKLQLHLPLGDVPEMGEYIKFLDKGLLAVGCYLIAYNEYLEKKYAKALGVAEIALNLCDETYILPQIYLNLVSAMSYINLLETEKAKECVEKAWMLAREEELIMPFVEHYNLMGGLVESFFKKNNFEVYEKIIKLSKEYNRSWYEVHNAWNERSVPTTLTNVEFTIAMLYSRNWRVKEIASHMHLSERTVTNYISYIYDKLQINSKKELEKYMLK